MQPFVSPLYSYLFDADSLHLRYNKTEKVAMESYTRQELQQLCKEYNKTAKARIKCNGNNHSIYDALLATGTLERQERKGRQGRKEGTLAPAPQQQTTTKQRHTAFDEELLAELEPLSHLQLTEYCTTHKEVCNNELLWKTMFERVFRDLYQLFKDIEFPDIEKSKQRKHSPWHTVYIQVLALSSNPSMLAAVESIVNDEKEPLDKWRRADLADLDLVSFALAMMNEHYLQQLADDESYLIDWIPIKPARWKVLLNRTTSARLLTRYLDIQSQLSEAQRLTLHNIEKLIERAIETDNADLFALLVPLADATGINWRNIHTIKKRIGQSGNISIFKIYNTRNGKIEVNNYTLRFAGGHPSFLRDLIAGPERELQRSDWNTIIRNLEETDIETLQFFLSKIEPDISDLASIAIRNPRIEVLELLRSYGNIFVGEILNDLLADIIRTRGDEEIIRYILDNSKDEKLDFDIIFNALYFQSTAIFNILLADPRFDPSLHIEELVEALRNLLNTGKQGKINKEKVKILLSDERFVQNLTNEQIKQIKDRYNL